MIRALEQLERLARHPEVPILIEGETGTGKTMVARHLHALSPRSAEAFQQVTLAALEDSLASSDLFGHVEGAYTDARGPRSGCFAAAQHGTIFLDEIGKASPAIQQKLLHAVEQKEITPLGSDRSVRVDVRVIAASNVALADAVAASAFLPDLYARFEPFRVQLPPLRERRADIPLLVERCIGEHTGESRAGRVRPVVHEALMDAFQDAPWPGNVRQLSGTIRRLLIEAGDSDEITFEHCPDTMSWLSDLQGSAGPLSGPRLEQALAETNNNKTLAARKLGKSRSAVQRALRRLEQH
ncbi:MAG TPA: sigma 54-interacting transcriptional regulator [Gemmatimonadaceae bacterium]|jgi:DNA-binding NtrC family response regulator